MPGVVTGAPSADARFMRWASIGVVIVVTAYAAVATLLAVLIPFHAWDALTLGGWSRLIAATGHMHFDEHGAWFYHRPLLYVAQGWIWRIFGFHESLGRLLALAFSALLVLSVFRLGRVLSSTPRLAAVALLLMLSVPDFADGAVSGLTDVPVAALIAATAALAWKADGYVVRRLAIVCCATAAALTKPSALPSLLGLSVALLPGPRLTWRTRAVDRAAPVLLGVVLALAWYAAEAQRVGVSLTDFLRTGTTAFYASLADQQRGSALLIVAVLGVGAIVPLVYSLRSRTGDAPLPRGDVAKLMIWALPGVAAWIVVTPYATRLIAPAWPPLVVLMAAAVSPIVAPGRTTTLRIVGGAMLLLLAAANMRNLDRGWGFHQLPAIAASRFDTTVARHAALGSFTDAVAVIDGELGAEGRLFASDGRFSFFFPGRHTSRYPQSCADLQGFSAFALSTDEVSRLVQERWIAASADPAYWSACTHPRLVERARLADIVIYRVDDQPAEAER